MILLPPGLGVGTASSGESQRGSHCAFQVFAMRADETGSSTPFQGLIIVLDGTNFDEDSTDSDEKRIGFGAPRRDLTSARVSRLLNRSGANRSLLKTPTVGPILRC